MAEEPATAGQHRWQRWTSWMLLAAVLVVAAAGLIWALTVIPAWLYPPLPAAELGQISDPARRTEAKTNRLKLQNDARATILQGLAGIAVLGGAIVAARQLRLGRDQLQHNRDQLQHNLEAGREQLELSRSGQLTERFTRAIDQLGSQGQLEVVLGGIYALERIAHDSPEYRATIAEILSAYVRTHAPWPPSRPGQYVSDAPIEQLPPLQTRAPDVQAALTVLGRGEFVTRVDLHSTDLRRAGLTSANLQGAMLSDANLHGALLSGASLQGTWLSHARLQGALLDGASLQGAWLRGASLQEALLDGASLQGATLDGANLQRAGLVGANLQEAILDDTKLGKSRLVGAILEGTSLRGANLQEAELVGANLKRAQLNSANLPGAWLLGADLRGALLDGAWLQRAVLDNANLQDARLVDADLRGAHLFAADLQGAGLDGANLEEAQADSDTTWPDGFNPSAAGVLLLPTDDRADGGSTLPA